MFQSCEDKYSADQRESRRIQTRFDVYISRSIYSSSLNTKVEKWPSVEKYQVISHVIIIQFNMMSFIALILSFIISFNENMQWRHFWLSNSFAQLLALGARSRLCTNLQLTLRKASWLHLISIDRHKSPSTHNMHTIK